jgi:uncharacterized protein (DUF952 family)
MGPLSWRQRVDTVESCSERGRSADRFNKTFNHLPDQPSHRISHVSFIYKICPASAWREAERQGVYRGSRDDARDGYIHFSTAAQVEATARKHYFGQKGLFLIEVETDALGDALRWEPSRNDEFFPHLYGELDLGAVRRVLDLPARSDGTHDIPELTP